jgi:hypothetical protein
VSCPRRVRAIYSDAGNKTLKVMLLYLRSEGFKYEKCDG